MAMAMRLAVGMPVVVVGMVMGIGGHGRIGGTGGGGGIIGRPDRAEAGHEADREEGEPSLEAKREEIHGREGQLRVARTASGMSSLRPRRLSWRART